MEFVLDAVRWQWCRKKKNGEKKIPDKETYVNRCIKARNTRCIKGI